MTVTELVERERASLRRAHLTAGGAGAAAAALVILALGAVALGASRWLSLPRAAPFLVWAAVGGACALALSWTRRTLRRDASPASVAGLIEQEQGLRAGSLRGVMEVGDASQLGRYAAEAIASKLGEPSTLAPAERHRAARRGQGAAAGAVVALLLLVLVAGVARDGLAAIFRPVAAWRGTLLVPLAFTDVPTTLLRGESLAVGIRAPGRDAVRLGRRAVGGAWSAVVVPVDRRTGLARVSLGRADADLVLVATDGRAVTDTLTVHVTDRPFVGDLALRAEYPAYLGRRTEALAAGERLRLPRGTRLLVSGRSSVALDALELARDSARAIALHPAGFQFAGALLVDASATWRFRAVSRSRVGVDVPAPLDVEMLPDSAPRVDLRAPAADTTVVPGEPVRLAIEVGDDHGLANVAVRSWRERAGSGALAPVIQQVAAPPDPIWRGDVVLSAAAGLEPGDRLHIVVTATDRSPWRQTGESRELVLRVPSLGDQRESVRRLADSAAAAAAAVASSQRQLEQRSGELSRTRPDRSASSGTAGGTGQSRGAPPMDYASAERARALAREQRDLAAKLDAVREQARQVERQLKQAGALDSGLSARLEEAQRLLREAMTPELAAKLQAMENAAAGQSGDDARSAMQDLAREQQRARQQLEQGVEMLKRAALEGAMQTLRDDARDVAQRERTLADSLSRGRPSGAEPQQLAARSRQLESNVQNVRARLEREGAKAGPQRMEAAAEHAGKSAGEMARASNPAQRDDAGRAGQGAERGAGQEGTRKEGGAGQQSEPAGAASRAAAEMEQAARDLTEAREAQVGQWKQDLTRDLDQSIQETLQLAREENSLAEQASGQPQSEATPSPAESQQRQGGAGQQRDTAKPREEAAQRGAPPGAQGSPGSPPPAADQRTAQPVQSAQAGKQNASEQNASGQGAGEKQAASGQQPGGQQSTGQQGSGRQRSGQPEGGASPDGSGSRSGMSPGEVRSRQSTLQQGTNRTAERLEQAGRKSALVSPRSQRAMADARRKVEAATKETASGGQSAAGSMQEAAEALNQAAAAMVRDRERANNASSASGLPELLQRMQEAAKQQGSVNAQSASGLQMGRQAGAGQSGASLRGLARQQRKVAQSLEEVGDADATGRTDALAKEARDLAQALERGAADDATLARQQRLHRRLLDAGRSMEQEEREDNGRREAQAAAGNALFTPDAATASGRAAARYREPGWNDLRGLTAEERRLVLEYFKRLNAAP